MGSPQPSSLQTSLAYWNTGNTPAPLLSDWESLDRALVRDPSGSSDKPVEKE